jgi:hypothetical protein
MYRNKNIKSISVNFDLNKVINILRNVNIESMCRYKDNILYIIGKNLYADSDGVYSEIRVYDADLKDVGISWFSIPTYINYIEYLLNR